MRVPEKFEARRVRFLGEQDGIPERRLKTLLVPLFEKEPRVSKAYLVRATYGGPQETLVGLCIRAETAPEETLVVSIAAVFAGLFAREVPLDIMFVTSEQEAELAKCCKPFFEAAIDREP